MKQRKQRQKTSIRFWLAMLMLYSVPTLLYVGSVVTTWFSFPYYTPSIATPSAWLSFGSGM